jgi:dolichol kinase
MRTLRMIGFVLLGMLAGLVVAVILLIVAYAVMLLALGNCLAALIEQKAREVERYPCTETRSDDD